MGNKDFIEGLEVFTTPMDNTPFVVGNTLPYDLPVGSVSTNPSGHTLLCYARPHSSTIQYTISNDGKGNYTFHSFIQRCKDYYVHGPRGTITQDRYLMELRRFQEKE